VGYELHITRAPLWIDSAEHPITRDEWEAFALGHPDMRDRGTIEFADAEAGPVFGHTCVDGTEVSLWWYQGRIDIDGVRTKRAQNTLAPMAEALNARLLGDDGEQYEGGTRPPFLDRFRRRG
jgi:hypothetical protein